MNAVNVIRMSSHAAHAFRNSHAFVRRMRRNAHACIECLHARAFMRHAHACAGCRFFFIYKFIHSIRLHALDLMVAALLYILKYNRTPVKPLTSFDCHTVDCCLAADPGGPGHQSGLGCWSPYGKSKAAKRYRCSLPEDFRG